MQQPGTSRVDVLVATTRSAENIPPEQLFGGERSLALNFADVAVSIPADAARAVGEVQWPARLPANPSIEFAALQAEKLTKAQALDKFAARLKKTPSRSVLLFVHGYNTRFEEAVFRLAQITHDSKAPALPVLFTWPSRGTLLGYAYDRESGNYSRDALEAVIQNLVDNKAVSDITILAHSMGNWVTLEALRQMSIRNRGLPSKLSHVMLAAPDVDVDVFRKQMIEIGEKRPPFTLMISQDDKALAISRRVWGSTARLGSIDPEAEPYKTALKRARLTVIDLTGDKSQDSLNHGKFAESPVVAQLIGRQVARQSIDDSRTGVGEAVGFVVTSTANTVGRAASIVVTAPLAVVDGRTREGFSDQIDDLGARINHTVSSVGDVADRR